MKSCMLPGNQKGSLLSGDLWLIRQYYSSCKALQVRCIDATSENQPKLNLHSAAMRQTLAQISELCPRRAPPVRGRH